MKELISTSCNSICVVDAEMELHFSAEVAFVFHEWSYQLQPGCREPSKFSNTDTVRFSCTSDNLRKLSRRLSEMADSIEIEISGAIVKGQHEAMLKLKAFEKKAESKKKREGELKLDDQPKEGA